MNRLVFALLFLVLLCDHALHAAPPRPNIILIMADDFGYECVTANGGQSYQTPNLDRLAAAGMRFEQCHVQQLCTPTRVQLMTGRYNVRNYSPRQGRDLTAREFVFDHDNKLYRTGQFFDLQADPFEQMPLDPAALTGTQTAERGKLQTALDQFKDARPAELDRQFEAEMMAQPANAAPKKKNRNNQ